MNAPWPAGGGAGAPPPVVLVVRERGLVMASPDGSERPIDPSRAAVDDALAEADAMALEVPPALADVSVDAKDALASAMDVLPFAALAREGGFAHSALEHRFTGFDHAVKGDESAPSRRTGSDTLLEAAREHFTSAPFRQLARRVAPGLSPYLAKGLLARLTEAARSVVERGALEYGGSASVTPAVIDLAALPAPWPRCLQKFSVLSVDGDAGLQRLQTMDRADMTAADVVVVSVSATGGTNLLARQLAEVLPSVRSAWRLVVIMQLFDEGGGSHNALVHVHNAAAEVCGGGNALVDLALVGVPGRDYLPRTAVAAFQMWNAP